MPCLGHYLVSDMQLLSGAVSHRTGAYSEADLDLQLKRASQPHSSPPFKEVILLFMLHKQQLSPTY